MAAAVGARPIGNDRPALVPEPFPNIWTAKKTLKLALYIFAALALLGSATLIGFAISGAIRTSACWALPLTILGAGAIFWAHSTVDYGNPKELHKLRLEAHDLPFRKLHKKHGLENLAKYIAKDEGPSPGKLQEKFRREETKVLTILDTYNIQDLRNKGFTSAYHDTVLQTCKGQEAETRRQFFAAERALDRRYSHRTDKLHQHVNTAHVGGYLVAGDHPQHRQTINTITNVLATAGHVGAEIFGANAQHDYDEGMRQARQVRDADWAELQNFYQRMIVN